MRYSTERSICYLSELPEDVSNILDPGEKILLAVKQSLDVLPEMIFVTNRRLIFRKSSALGLKKTLTDYPYSDIVNITIDRGLVRSTVDIKMRSGGELKITDIPKEEAYQLHRAIRERISRVHEEAKVVEPSSPLSAEAKKIERLKCPRCSREVIEEFTICPHCGFGLKLKCQECGKQVSAEFRICPFCGADLEESAYLEEPY